MNSYRLSPLAPRRLSDWSIDFQATVFTVFETRDEVSMIAQKRFDSRGLLIAAPQPNHLGRRPE
jgi:small-conductance mechanosensitive channel